MPKLQTRIEPTLASLSDADLRSITAGGHPFGSVEWFRLLERLDLSALTGGNVTLQFAIVTAGGTALGLCPLLRARGPGLFALYSIRRYYFEYLFEQAAHSNLQASGLIARIAPIVGRLGRLLESIGCSLDDSLIVCNPLSYRGGISMTPSTPVASEEVSCELVSALKQYAAEIQRPLCFLCFEGDDDPAVETLRKAGCQEVFLFYDNKIDLSCFHEFDDYVQSFPSRYRKRTRKEIRQTSDAGIRFRLVDDFTDHANDFSRLYRETYSKHSASILEQPPEFWTTLQQTLGGGVEALLAEHDDRLVGFSVLLKSDRRREMWVYRGGRHDSDSLKQVPYYFSMGFYEPVRRAIQLGYQKIWLGPAGYETKIRRGARQTPLFSYFWFPRRRDRWLLRRVLRRFGRVVRRQLAGTLDVPFRMNLPPTRDSQQDKLLGDSLSINTPDL